MCNFICKKKVETRCSSSSSSSSYFSSSSLFCFLFSLFFLLLLLLLSIIFSPLVIFSEFFVNDDASSPPLPLFPRPLPTRPDAPTRDARPLLRQEAPSSQQSSCPSFHFHINSVHVSRNLETSLKHPPFLPPLPLPPPTATANENAGKIRIIEALLFQGFCIYQQQKLFSIFICILFLILEIFSMI